MEIKIYFLAFVLLMLIFSACGAGIPSLADVQTRPVPGTLRERPAASKEAATSSLGEETDLTPLLRSLDELAELERAGSWFQGMGLTESGIREKMSDYAGAVAAAYKELSWAFGKGIIEKHRKNDKFKRKEKEKDKKKMEKLEKGGKDTWVSGKHMKSEKEPLSKNEGENRQTEI